MKLHRLSSILHRWATGRVALLATVIFVLFTSLVLPRQAAEAEITSGGAGSPDTSFWYTPNDLYQMAESYGLAGRQAYLKARWTFDLVWPVVYTIFLSLTISWVFQRAFASENYWQLANLIPVAGMLFDYLENSVTSLVMARYPALTPGIAHLAPLFTLTKWVFVNGSFVLLLIGIVVALWRKSTKTTRLTTT
ncbi:MAG TPA: hypothetical protein PLJ78_14855 [Anaerolineae bacterium]|nr:hypothetical protein [Anaerolineae bacterium]HQK15210.1 hypothetical protein [Anaerolineae bacterium]